MLGPHNTAREARRLLWYSSSFYLLAWGRQGQLGKGRGHPPSRNSALQKAQDLISSPHFMDELAKASRPQPELSQGHGWYMEKPGCNPGVTVRHPVLWAACQIGQAPLAYKNTPKVGGRNHNQIWPEYLVQSPEPKLLKDLFSFLCATGETVHGCEEKLWQVCPTLHSYFPNWIHTEQKPSTGHRHV